MLRNKAQKNIYRFKKEYNDQGVEIDTLYNYKNKPVYRAYVTEKGQSENTYCFHDIGKKIRTSHTIGKTTKNDTVFNYRMASFDFDGVDVWKWFSQLGITLRLTNLNDNDSVYRIFQDGEELGSARMKTKSESKTIRFKSEKNNDKLLFFIAFAISHIY